MWLGSDEKGLRQLDVRGKALVATLSLAACLPLAGCLPDDGHSGIPTQDSTESASPAAAPPSTTVAASASPAPAAATGIDAFAADLRRDPAVVRRTCWTVAPQQIDAMYADPPGILQALGTPSVTSGEAVTWRGATETVVAQQGEIGRDYACPRVAPAGSTPGYTAADARHTVRRYLLRQLGRPIDPTDTETAFPLLCDARVGDAPLTGFDDAEITSSPLPNESESVTVPVTGDTGANITRVFTLTPVGTGYCIGAITS